MRWRHPLGRFQCQVEMRRVMVSDLVGGWRRRRRSRVVVDQDEFVEVELVGESFPFRLVQDALVVVVSASEMFSVSGCQVCVCTSLG